MTLHRLWRNLICRIGIHQRESTYSIAPRCDWCHHRSRRQKRITAANVARIDRESHDRP